MTENTESDPAQPLPRLTLKYIAPEDYNVIIGRNNPRVDFRKLKIFEPNCQVAKDILMIHPCRQLLKKSVAIPYLYIHQFWITAKSNKKKSSFTVTINRTEYLIDADVLREALLLPKPKKEFDPMPTDTELLQFFLDIGYDIQNNNSLDKPSDFDVKYLPQPWRTICMIVTRSIAGRDTGHEHPKLQHLQVFWESSTTS